MAKRISKRSDAGQKPSQGYKLRRASLERYVKLAEFRAGLADRVANTQPGPFHAWPYEHGRSVANAIMADGADPLAATDRALAKRLGALFRDGTLIP